MRKESDSRVTRRQVGQVAARSEELPFESVTEPRKGNPLWSFRSLMTSIFVGMVAGCRGLGQVEQLTGRLGAGARRTLHIARRVPDTTMRDLIMALGPHVDELRGLLYVQIRRATRRKQITHDLPVRAVSMDGRTTMTWLADAAKASVKFAQRQKDKWAVRTITSCLASATGRPCLDMHPVPPTTNEMGAFVAALDALLSAYGRTLFDVVMYDAGACSLANASAVIARKLDYVLCLTGQQGSLYDEATRLLAKLPATRAVAETTDIVGSRITTRRLWLTRSMAGWLDWNHLQTVLRVESVTEDKSTGKITTESRYYVSSLAHDRMQPAQWLALLRRRWSVENNCHNTWDKILREDDRPWIKAPAGMVVTMVLRRLAYNMLTLYRSVTTRSETKRARGWTELIEDFKVSLYKATQEVMAGVRRRAIATS